MSHKVQHMIGTPIKARHSTPIHKPGKRLMHSIPLRFVQKRVGGHGHKSVSAELNLTSMIDYLVITVVFLLSNFGTAQEMASQQGLEVPSVPNADPVKSAPIVSISRQGILLNSQRMLTVEEAQASTGVIARLDEALRQSRREFPTLHPNEQFSGDIVFQIDKSIVWSLVKQVAMTCAQAGYVNLNFAVNRGASSQPGATPTPGGG